MLFFTYETEKNIRTMCVCVLINLILIWFDLIFWWFNATFSSISTLSWRPVLVVESSTPFFYFTKLGANTHRIGDGLVWAVRSNDLTHWATRAPCVYYKKVWGILIFFLYSIIYCQTTFGLKPITTILLTKWVLV